MYRKVIYEYDEEIKPGYITMKKRPYTVTKEELQLILKTCITVQDGDELIVIPKPEMKLGRVYTVVKLPDYNKIEQN